MSQKKRRHTSSFVTCTVDDDTAQTEPLAKLIIGSTSSVQYRAAGVCFRRVKLVCTLPVAVYRADSWGACCHNGPGGRIDCCAALKPQRERETSLACSFRVPFTVYAYILCDGWKQTHRMQRTPRDVFFPICAENPKMRNRCSARPADMFSFNKEEADELTGFLPKVLCRYYFRLHDKDDIVNRSEREVRADWVAPPKKNMMKKKSK